MSRASRLPKAEEPPKPEVNLEGILDRNLALEDEVRDLKQLLGRPITIQGQDAEAWRKFMDYMPQLTHLATNVSMTASAVQANKASLDSINLTLQRIATALEGGNVLPNPPAFQPIPQAVQLVSDAERKRIGQFRGRSCNCEQNVTHPYQPGWCPPTGPRL